MPNCGDKDLSMTVDYSAKGAGYITSTRLVSPWAVTCRLFTVPFGNMVK